MDNDTLYIKEKDQPDLDGEWVNGEFKLVKAEKIPDWDKRSLWAQEDRNRKAMLDLFGIEYPEVERPIDDTEDYGDKFEEDLSDKLPEEEPEDDE